MVVVQRGRHNLVELMRRGYLVLGAAAGEKEVTLHQVLHQVLLLLLLLLMLLLLLLLLRKVHPTSTDRRKL